MNYHVTVQQLAVMDLHATFNWIESHSVTGAQRWYQAYLEALQSLTQNPLNYGFANESQYLSIQVRERFFGTSSRHKYHLVYTIDGTYVRVLRLRGPGQDLLTAEEIQ